MTISVEKSDLRKQMRAKRKALSAQAPTLSAAICSHLTAWAEQQSPRPLAGYLAIGSEADVSGAMAVLSERQGWTVCVPRIDQGGVMDFAKWHPGKPLEAGPYSIAQPSMDETAITPATILVPLIAFDGQGGRLGQGGGFFDRTLARLKAETKVQTIGVAFSIQEVPQVPTESHDATLNAVVTEHGLRYLA